MKKEIKSLTDCTDLVKECLIATGANIGALILRQPSGAMGVFISGKQGEIENQKEFLLKAIERLQEIVAGIDDSQIDTSTDGPNLFIGDGKGNFKADRLPEDEPESEGFAF